MRSTISINNILYNTEDVVRSIGCMQDKPLASRPDRLPSRGIAGRDVELAADALLREGKRPTIERIREKIGRGSPNTINPLLDAWWKRLAARLDAGPAALHRLPEFGRSRRRSPLDASARRGPAARRARASTAKPARLRRSNRISKSVLTFLLCVKANCRRALRPATGMSPNFGFRSAPWSSEHGKIRRPLVLRRPASPA